MSAPRTPAARMLWIGAAVLVIAQLLLRTYVLARGGFYWDDIAFMGRAADGLGPGMWWTDYDGHLMPGTLLASGLITTLAPLSWPAAAASLLVLQAGASLAMLRALVIIVGRRPIALLPFAFYLFSPLTLSGFAWWAAGLNTLPMQIGLAIAVAETIRYARTRRWQSAALALGAYVIAAFFFEKSLVIPFVAVFVVGLAAAMRGRDVRAALRRALPLWIAYAAVTAVWLGLYLLIAAPRPGDHTLQYTGRALSRSLHSVLAPAAIGGPWSWYRANPGPPILVPNMVVTAVGALVIVGILAVTAWRSPRGVLAWAGAGLYFFAALAPVYWLRSSAVTSLLLPMSLRYFPDFAAVLTLAGGLVATARVVPPEHRRTRFRTPAALRARRRFGAVAVAVAFVLSATVSTARFATVWHDNPTASYLRNLTAGARERAGSTVLDEQVDSRVLSKLSFPNNKLSRILDRYSPRPDFKDYAPEPTLVDRSGRFVDGRVTRVRSVQPGPIPGCGFRVDEYEPVKLAYEGPLNFWDWVVQLNYLASGPGEITIRQDGYGALTTVPVTRGPHTLYVRVPGAGHGLLAQALTQGLIVCVSGGPVGLLVPQSTPGE
ncbi:hypothetical protein P0W64_09125 [Tsukamurella sp. 8F]|uniref:hypothetical protein n=1 Tax=unclassified Tsukamurella TaxID=2633480 RepID=UPI0023B91DF2|nr:MULTISPECIES: hypothetical protein [unclassified Tsukamurella]MDF0531927.1 hypothetical protein [Tsukamurella sp. 8J]MDF0586933.1 hypothetical protein [Tsukamurella sp. 8F]